MSAFEDVDALLRDQRERAFDIYALGPFLIWAGMQKRPLGKWSRRTLIAAGFMTLVYNWTRYKELARAVQ